VVDEVSSSVMLVGDEPFDADPAVPDVPLIARVPDDTEVTFPLAKLIGAPEAPAGRPAPPAAPPPPPARPKPPPPVGRVALHVPAEVGCVMLTDRAVIVPLDDVPVAATQSPTATADAAAVLGWLKAVDAVQLTVT
jgi:hypothetical protein